MGRNCRSFTLMAGRGPRITIVTPSLNQGQYLEETIRSVLLQGYPNLEYFIIDGGSTDETVSVIRKYEKWLTGWVSEPDGGQAHAINKGFGRATGHLLAWINSDDLYLPGVFDRIADLYSADVPTGDFWHVSGVDYFDAELEQHVTGYQADANDLRCWVSGDANLNQQGTFFDRQVFLKVGTLDETLHYGFDKEYWMRMLAAGYRFSRDELFVGGRWRMHDACKWKSRNDAFKYEWALLSLRYGKDHVSDWPKARRGWRKAAAFHLTRMAQARGLSRVSRLLLVARAAGLIRQLLRISCVAVDRVEVCAGAETGWILPMSLVCTGGPWGESAALDKVWSDDSRGTDKREGGGR